MSFFSLYVVFLHFVVLHRVVQSHKLFILVSHIRCCEARAKWLQNRLFIARARNIKTFLSFYFIFRLNGTSLRYIHKRKLKKIRSTDFQLFSPFSYFVCLKATWQCQVGTAVYVYVALLCCVNVTSSFTFYYCLHPIDGFKFRLCENACWTFCSTFIAGLLSPFYH